MLPRHLLAKEDSKISETESAKFTKIRSQEISILYCVVKISKVPILSLTPNFYEYL